MTTNKLSDNKIEELRGRLRLSEIRHGNTNVPRNEFHLEALRVADDALSILEQIPKWVSVSERLPPNKRYKKYVFTTKQGGTDCDYWNPERKTFETDEGLCSASIEDVTHWMPLPEPYRKEQP